MNGLIPEKIYTWGLRTWNLHDTEEKAYGNSIQESIKKEVGLPVFKKIKTHAEFPLGLGF